MLLSRKKGKNIRFSVAKALKEIFKNHIKRSYGGYISRVASDDAVMGSYEVHIFSRSDNLSTDPQFSELAVEFSGGGCVGGGVIHGSFE